MLTIRNHEYKNKTKITLNELNNIQWENFELGYKCGYEQCHQQLTNEIEYAQKLLESNNELIKEVEELEDTCNECLEELERYREILKVIAPEMIDEE